jgi:cysteine desulfurase/selenocysteine lyase
MASPTVAPSSPLKGVAEQFPILARAFANGPLCFLDSAATAQKPLAVLEAMEAGYRDHYASIHRGVYPLAQEATDGYEGARGIVAQWINASLEEVIFTRNATEAFNLVAYSWGRANIRPGDVILLTEMEHHSNIVPWQILAAERGARIDYVPIDTAFRLDLEALDEKLARGPKLVCVTHVSNVLGTINPIEEIVRRGHAAGAVVLVDGAQAAPHISLDMRALGADFYAFTGHKIYGPSGIGVLYGRRELLEAMPPFLGGGDMIRTVSWSGSTWNDLPWKFEAGTSPIVEGAGLGAAVRWLAELGMDRVRAHEDEVVSYAVERLQEVPNLTIYGPIDEPRGSVISFAIEGVHPHDVAEILGRENICIRAGHHCAQPLMRRLGVAATSRPSFAVHNTRADVDRLLDGLANVRSIFALA